VLSFVKKENLVFSIFSWWQ